MSGLLVPAFLETILSLLQQIFYSPLHCIPLYLPISTALPCGLRRESNTPICVHGYNTAKKQPKPTKQYTRYIQHTIYMYMMPNVIYLLCSRNMLLHFPCDNRIYRDIDSNLKIKLLVVSDYSIGFLSELLLLPAF